MECPRCGATMKILSEETLGIYDNCENLIRTKIFGGCPNCHKQYNWERDYSWGDNYIDFNLNEEWSIA